MEEENAMAEEEVGGERTSGVGDGRTGVSTRKDVKVETPTVMGISSASVVGLESNPIAQVKMGSEMDATQLPSSSFAGPMNMMSSSSPAKSSITSAAYWELPLVTSDKMSNEQQDKPSQFGKLLPAAIFRPPQAQHYKEKQRYKYAESDEVDARQKEQRRTFDNGDLFEQSLTRSLLSDDAQQQPAPSSSPEQCWVFNLNYTTKVFDIPNPYPNKEDTLTGRCCRRPNFYLSRVQETPLPLKDIQTFEVLNMWRNDNFITEIFVDWELPRANSSDGKRKLESIDDYMKILPIGESISGETHVALSGIFKKLPCGVQITSLTTECEGCWSYDLGRPVVFIFRSPKAYRDARWILFASINRSVVINATGLPTTAYIELEVPKKDSMPMIRIVLATNKQLWHMSNDALTRKMMFQKRITVPKASNYMAVSVWSIIIIFLIVFLPTLLVNAQQNGQCDLYWSGLRSFVREPVNPFMDAVLMVTLLIQVLLLYYVFYNSATSADPSINEPMYSDTISDLFKEDKIVMIVLYSILLAYSDLVRLPLIDEEDVKSFLRISFLQLFTVNATFVFSISMSGFKTLIHASFVATFSVMTLFSILLTGTEDNMEFDCRLIALFALAIGMFFFLKALLWLSKDRYIHLILIPFSLAFETMILFVPFFTTNSPGPATKVFSTADICIMTFAVVICLANLLYMAPGFRRALIFANDVRKKGNWMQFLSPAPVEIDDSHTSTSAAVAAGARN